MNGFYKIFLKSTIAGSRMESDAKFYTMMYCTELSYLIFNADETDT